MNTSPVPEEVPRLPSGLPASLDDILITDRLSARPHRLPRAASENKALRALATVMANSPEELPDTLLSFALELCNADTAGLSLLETTSTGETIFRWTNLAGALKGHVGGFTPRGFSPCGVVLDRRTAQLFSHPGYRFQYFGAAGVPFVEALVVPLSGDHPLGTIWI